MYENNKPLYRYCTLEFWVLSDEQFSKCWWFQKCKHFDDCTIYVQYVNQTNSLSKRLWEHPHRPNIKKENWQINSESNLFSTVRARLKPKLIIAYYGKISETLKQKFKTLGYEKIFKSSSTLGSQISNNKKDKIEKMDKKRRVFNNMRRI